MRRLILIAEVFALCLSFSCRRAQEQAPQQSAAVCPAPQAEPADTGAFVLLTDVVPDVLLEIRYFSTYNFVGRRIDGYEQPIAILTREAAAALKKASDELLPLGYRLKIFDAYRPQSAVNHFARWAKATDDTLMKACFYPQLNKSVLFSRGFIAHKSGHSRGSTVDLTLFDISRGREVDMGGNFDYFGALSHPDYQGVTAEQQRMRKLLRDVMLRNGFKPYDKEWWHFTLRNEPFPATYFDFPVHAASVGR